MAPARDNLPATLRKAGKALKSAGKSTSPDSVHRLRTQSRRLEAAMNALGIEEKPRVQRLSKTVKRLRRKAGKVRDLDVFIGFSANLAAPGQNGAIIQMIEHLAAKRKKKARELEDALSRGDKAAKRQLKRCRGLFRAGADDPEQQLKVESAILQMSSDLTSWPRIIAANLHLYRIKLKELRYTIELAHGSDAELVSALGEATDAIGEWHDWQELQRIALDLPACKDDPELLHTIRATVSAKLKRALSLANMTQKQYLTRLTAIPHAAHR